MKKSSLKELDYLIAWVVFFICATIGGAFAGLIGGLFIGVVLGASGSSPDILRAAGAIVGFVFAMPISYITFRLVVAKFIVGKMETVPVLSSASEPYVPPPQ